MLSNHMWRRSRYLHHRPHPFRKLSKTLMSLIDAAHSSISPLLEILPCSAAAAKGHSRLDATRSLLDSCEDEGLKRDVSKVDIPGLPARRLPATLPEKTAMGLGAAGAALPFSGIGEVISREEAFAPPQTVDANKKTTATALPCSKKRFKTLLGKVDGWKTGKDACAFAEDETRVRKAARKEAVTKKLDQAQWKELRAHIKAAAPAASKGGKKLGRLRECVLAWVLYPELKGKKPTEWDYILKQIK